MISEDAFAGLTEAIHAAGADLAYWPVTLALLADAFGVNGATLSVQGEKLSDCFMVVARLDPAAVAQYVAYYHQKNPIWSRVPDTPEGTVQTDAMVMAKDLFRKTEFYNDFLAPQGTKAMLNGVAALEEGRQTIVTLHGKQEFERPQTQLYRRLLPHIQSAVALNHRFSRLEANWAASGATLDHLDQAAFLVDRRGRVLFMNTAADALCSRQTGLAVRGGMLEAGSAAANARLLGLIADCQPGAAARGAGGGVSIANDAGELKLRVMPLRYQAPGFIVDQPVAVVFAASQAPSTTSLVGWLRDRLGLTGAEAALAVEMMAGDGVQAVADRLGISRATARTHLARVFDKSGKRRQAELVDFLHRLSRDLERSGPSSADPS